MSKKQAKRTVSRKTRYALKGVFDGPSHLGTKRAAHINYGDGMNPRAYRTENSSNTDPDYISEIEDPDLLLDR